MPQEKPYLRETGSAQELTSTYYFYREEEHVQITQAPKPKPRRRWRRQKEASLLPEDPNGYIIHTPYVSFHQPPQTLRRGGSKTAPPICLIHNYGLWRRWKVQFGDRIADAIDPRGVVGWGCRTNPDNSVEDDCALKGYRVRSWRLWAESGKRYHKEVNAKRKEGVYSEDDLFPHQPVQADEAISLNWTRPFSRRTRWYQFQYGGVELCWKGTRSLPEGRKWARRLMPIHHLKLTAKSPGDGGSEVVLAQFFCSFDWSEYGDLVILDEEVSRVFQCDVLSDDVGLYEKKGGVLDRIHEVIIATSWCMVLGEFRKRKATIELLIEIACAWS
ncbi:uncharacterized protein BDW43DRAFT_119688 [Aspergillus alliaceus]|uniref:uncharacterized protein n=1 Tax=Petromyces alliaceus TaxID=209559 RepID=UPI0012A3E96E|nr:uncharacterized protein BDW43DRAFT_119688 [Aspergillus alliaceus]KAB8238571.1 hypothetical protein BDW43DRAFT_119688 [Aspergillus alliaceus]